jgi:N-terminal domain of toast_rack, DUF2154
MNTKHQLITLVLFVALLLTGCNSQVRVGALQTESQSVELGNAESVRVEIDMGAGDLTLTGGAEKLMEADFTYNVARLKPNVDYTDGTLVVRQPEVNGFPSLLGIADFRNEWGVRLFDAVPMDLSVVMGGGTSDLQLAGLSLTKLDVTLGAAAGTIDLSGDWTHDLAITIDAGAGGLTVWLPRDVGVRVDVDRGATLINTISLTQDGNIYTNAAYGVSEVTLQIDLKTGIGVVNLDVEDAAATRDYSPVTGELFQLIPVTVEKAGLTGQSCGLNEKTTLAT